MFAAGGGATVPGHPGGVGVALSGIKIVLADEPARTLKSHLTGAGGSAAAGEAGKKIAESDPFGLGG